MPDNVAARYIRQKNASHYLELKPDGTCFIFEESGGITGRYEVHGTEIRIFGPDFTSTARIQNRVITDAEGDQWMRAAAADDGSLESITWLPPFLKQDLPWELCEAIVAAVVLIMVAIGATR